MWWNFVARTNEESNSAFGLDVRHPLRTVRATTAPRSRRLNSAGGPETAWTVR